MPQDQTERGTQSVVSLAAEAVLDAVHQPWLAMDLMPVLACTVVLPVSGHHQARSHSLDSFNVRLQGDVSPETLAAHAIALVVTRGGATAGAAWTDAAMHAASSQLSSTVVAWLADEFIPALMWHASRRELPDEEDQCWLTRLVGACTNPLRAPADVTSKAFLDGLRSYVCPCVQVASACVMCAVVGFQHYIASIQR